MAFTVVVHHSGLFSSDPHPHYREGRVTTVTDVDLDKWGYLECIDIVENMGYREGKFKLWWRTQDDAIARKFRPLLTDNDAMVLGTYAVDNRGLAHMFVEHDDDELTITPYATQPTKNPEKPCKPPSQKPPS